jgi:hypothetical protein
MAVQATEKQGFRIVGDGSIFPGIGAGVLDSSRNAY